MSDATTIYAIDNSMDYNVVAQTQCCRILVQENYNSQTPPTVDLLQKQPASAANAVNIPLGTVAIYSRQKDLSRVVFYPGEVVGTIRALNTNNVTSCTVKQVESAAV